MHADVVIPPPSPAALWIGRIISAGVALMMLMSAVMKLLGRPEVLEGFGQLGYDPSLALGIGVLELVCTLVYLLPRTAVLGALLLTGYLGGAIATHVRLGQPFHFQFLIGVFAWIGLYLRDTRVRDLLPFRVDPTQPRAGWLARILVTLVTAIVLLFVFVALQPAEFRIVRSATIAAPPEVVFDQVNDFHNWEAWSPWTKLDPNAKNTFEGPSAGTGAGFAWSGNDQIGAGRMTILDSRRAELIKIKLDFIRPFESTAITEFRFKPKDDGTEVAWDMSGENNLMSKALCLVMNMDKMVGGDFERGLAQIKAVAEAKTKK